MVVKAVIAGRGWLAVRGARLFSLLGTRIEGGVEIVCLPIATDRPGRSATWLPSLRDTAVENGWPVAGTVADAGLGPGDLLVSLQFDRVVDVADLGGARAVNLHFAEVPRHRGSLSCFWPIAERDPHVELTLHELTEVVDGGPVIATRRCPLSTALTAGELYRLLHREGFVLLAEHAESLLRGGYRVTAQPPGPPAHRRRDVDFEVREVTAFTGFDRPAAAARDSCLARIFPEFQVPTFRGRAVVCAYAVYPESLPGGVGDVVAETARSALIRCADGLLVLEFQG